jgi:hypothetical protein
MALRLGLIFSRKFIQQRRKHIVRDVPLELLNCSEMLLTGRTSGLNDFVLLVHEC